MTVHSPPQGAEYVWKDTKRHHRIEQIRANLRKNKVNARTAEASYLFIQLNIYISKTNLYYRDYRIFRNSMTLSINEITPLGIK